MDPATKRLDVYIDYEDGYVQPLIVSAVKSQFSSASLNFLDSLPAERSSDHPLLEIRAYEALDFENAFVAKQGSNLINAYIIRKAFIRKHYLSNTISTWLVKNPDSLLARHFRPAVDFELDYAEFLDDALIEAFELHEAFARNQGKPASEREWWILKPGMSDRGQGIRLFSTEEELREIFERWEEKNPDSDDEDEDEENVSGSGAGNKTTPSSDHIVTSHLRHFLAQPYIENPLLLPDAPFSGRKFHIRTYVVAAGALQVYVCQHMLALFASSEYAPPSQTQHDESREEDDDLIQRMRNVHLTNTCVQSALRPDGSPPPESVHLFSKLPIPSDQIASVQQQIGEVTADVFRAGLSHPTHFQPLPQCFEVFGLDFLVTNDPSKAQPLNAWLLEINAFPDFAQTGPELRDLVVEGLWKAVAKNVIGPYFSISQPDFGDQTFVKVLDVDIGRR